MRFTICFLLAAFSVCAEFRAIEITVLGMDCVSCGTGLTTKLKRLRGVETVELMPEKNLVSLKLVSGNSVRIDRVRDEIKAVGFNPRDAQATVIGTASSDGVRMMFLPDASKEMFALSGLGIEPGAHVTVVAKLPVPATPQEIPQLVVVSAKRD